MDKRALLRDSPSAFYISAVLRRGIQYRRRTRLSSRRFRPRKRQRSRNNYVNPLPRSRYISIPSSSRFLSSSLPFYLSHSLSFSFTWLLLSRRSRVSKGEPRETFSHAHNIKTLLRPFPPVSSLPSATPCP